jgi:hypothetical protein
MLRRILHAVEKDQRRRWAEIVGAIVLSLATVGSAWCAYQSTLWGGVQTFRLAASNAAGREASKLIIEGIQARAFDASFFVTYVEARGRQDEKVAAFLSERFRPEFRRAYDAWVKTDPLHDPNAPKSPFRMAEYVQKEVQEAQHQEAEAARMLDAAQLANQNSDRYVLLTVLFASVLFFGGIAGMIDSRRLRTIVFSVSVVFFLGTALAVAAMPICRE